MIEKPRFINSQANTKSDNFSLYFCCLNLSYRNNKITQAPITSDQTGKNDNWKFFLFSNKELPKRKK